MTTVQVKICGITTFSDAQMSIKSGADLLGFNFFPQSPRYVEPELVRTLIEEVREWRMSESGRYNSHPCKYVGVFVDATAAHIAQVLDFAGLDYAQLHGDEPPALLEQLSPRAFKVLRPNDADAVQTDAARYGQLAAPDGPQLLIDAYDPRLYGGTGKKADWHTVTQLAPHYPRLMLAGGLTPSNVAEAVRSVRPWGVDVSSGVEIAPGSKDHDAVRAFITAAKSVG